MSWLVLIDYDTIHNNNYLAFNNFLISPSNAQYRIVDSLIVEPIEGDPENLENATLYQDEYKLHRSSSGPSQQIKWNS